MGTSPRPPRWSEAEGPKTHSAYPWGLRSQARMAPVHQGPLEPVGMDSGSPPMGPGVATQGQWQRLCAHRVCAWPGLHLPRPFLSREEADPAEKCAQGAGRKPEMVSNHRPRGNRTRGPRPTALARHKVKPTRV